ncbi:MAG: hypothetical protein N2C12_18565, partial [Planctomycetales bacterium]
KAYPNEIVVIGVHSAKFDTEKETDNIRQAILRHDIEHPVINDSKLAIFRRHQAGSWPTLRVIDPQGNVIASNSGEIDFETLDRFFKSAIPFYKQRGQLDETPIRFDLERRQDVVRPLKFPGKVLADEESNRLYVSDTGHHRIVVTDLAGHWIENIGSGQVGAEDGSYKEAAFKFPQGMALAGGMLYVADTENHSIRKVDLAARQVSTVAGTGRQNRGGWPGTDQIESVEERAPKLPERWSSDPAKFPLASPWALLVHGDYLYIAMAGPHQIWRMSLDEDPQIEVYAGNGREDIVDGFLVPDRPPVVEYYLTKGASQFLPGYSSFAQPSGLATDGDWLYVADSEGSAVRAVPLSKDEKVTTVVGPTGLPRGKSLFTFGDTDGKGDEVRLQHVLGIAGHNGKLYLADTYNNKIKIVDIAERTSKTLVGDGKEGRQDDPPRFDEPSGLSYAAGKLYVADTNNHEIRTIDLAHKNHVTTLAIEGLKAPQTVEPPAADFPNARQIRLDSQTVKPTDGSFTLSVDLALPKDWKINPLAPLRYKLTNTEDGGPIDRSALGKSIVLPESERRSHFGIQVPITTNAGKDVLQLTLTCYYCRSGAEGFCKVASVVWTIPISLDESAKSDTIPLRYQFE